MFFNLNEPAGAIMDELAGAAMEESADQPMDHPANPPIALIHDVDYPMDDLMRTPPPNSQVATAVANWDSDWNPTSEHWFQASTAALDPCFQCHGFGQPSTQGYGFGQPSTQEMVLALIGGDATVAMMMEQQNKVEDPEKYQKDGAEEGECGDGVSGDYFSS